MRFWYTLEYGLDDEISEYVWFWYDVCGGANMLRFSSAQCQWSKLISALHAATAH
jgi:hypothetical protein